MNQNWSCSPSSHQSHAEKFPNGKNRALWSSCIATNGDYLLNGKETWYYPDGRKKYETTNSQGRKIGLESYWLPNGELKGTWDHHADGTAVWTQYWPGGGRKAESNWMGSGRKASPPVGTGKEKSSGKSLSRMARSQARKLLPK